MEVTVMLTDEVNPGQSPVVLKLPNGTLHVFTRDSTDEDGKRKKGTLEHSCEIEPESIPALVADGWGVLHGKKPINLAKLLAPSEPAKDGEE